MLVRDGRSLGGPKRPSACISRGAPYFGRVPLLDCSRMRCALLLAVVRCVGARSSCEPVGLLEQCVLEALPCLERRNCVREGARSLSCRRVALESPWISSTPGSVYYHKWKVFLEKELSAWGGLGPAIQGDPNSVFFLSFIV